MIRFGRNAFIEVQIHSLQSGIHSCYGFLCFARSLYGRVSALAAFIIQQATDGVDPTNWFPGFFHQQLSEIILVGEERFCIIFD